MIGKWDTQVSFMDFWSGTLGLVSIDDSAGDINLPNVVVAGIPSGATIIRVVGMYKYDKRVDNSGLANWLAGAQVISVDSAVGRDSVITMIDLLDVQFNTASDATEGGDVVMGDNDVKAEVTGNGTYYITWELADARTANLLFYGNQTGLRVYFR